MKENQHATKHSLSVEKQKCIDLQPEKRLNGYGWCCTKHRITELHGRQTKSYFLRFASGRLISTTAYRRKTALIVLVREVFTVERTVLDSRSY